MMILKLMMNVLMLGIVPYILGLYIRKMIPCKDGAALHLYCYVCGFFFMLALFEPVCVVASYMRLSFNVVVVLYSVLLMAVVAAVFIKEKIIKRLKLFSLKKTGQTIQKLYREWSGYEWIYLIAFLVLLGIQVYGAIFYFSTIYSVDDATYIAIGSSAIAKNDLYEINPYTGIYYPLEIKRVFQSSLIFYAYLAKVINVSVPTVAHTVLNTVLLLMAYCVYGIMAKDLFKKRDDQLIFLIFISLFFLFGNYTNYSHSFRLLATLWQGKAILAVILTPLLFILMRRILSEHYHWKYGLLLMILSASAVSLSLMGIATIFFVVVILTVLFALYNRNCRLLLYIIWACIIPGVIGAAYLLQRIM